jgi:H+-translocating NAD(P) transhydrogenase subunit alpha
MLHHAHFGSRRWHTGLLCVFSTILCLALASVTIAIAQETTADESTESAATTNQADAEQSQGTPAATESKPAASSHRLAALIGSLTIFVLAIFVGFEVINKVPPTLHTPLMSGSNAISGSTVVGALLATGVGKLGFGSFLGAAAVVLAMINVAGGFWVTHRMLAMFKKKKK